MYKLYFIFILCICCGEDYDNFEDLIWRRDEVVYPKPALNLYKTFFPTLANYEMNGYYPWESTYKWIARVIHSLTSEQPHICTAACIHEEIFITAYRCVASLKVTYTRIKYNTEMIRTKAFVFPTNTTKQSYDDIAFIVVLKEYYWRWHTIPLFDVNRTDDAFLWYENLDCNDTHRVVGFAMYKSEHRARSVASVFHLTTLEVHIDMKICQEIFTFNYLMGSFKVPCYHSCTLEEYRRDDKKCKNYHGVEGGAVINVKTNKLLGLATWGAYYTKYELPVGISVVNSDSFYKDFACAKLIQEDNKTIPNKDFYQWSCDRADRGGRRFGILT